MKAPSFTTTPSAATESQLINYLNTNPDFHIYLITLKLYLETNRDIGVLKEWWDKNYQNLVYTDVLLEFASLLEDLQITNSAKAQPSNIPSVAGTQAAQKPEKNKRLQFRYLPWKGAWFKLKNAGDFSGTKSFFIDYNQLLKRFAPTTIPDVKQVKDKIIIETGTDKHKHLAEISEWVAQKSSIKDSIYVLQAILQTHSPLVLYSGRVFKAACSCHHKLFRLFMASDFTDYNLKNGEALLHILDLPMAVAPNENGPAHLTPDYPFFGHDIFPILFDISSKSTLASLAIAWKKFYQKYNILCDTQNNNRVFVGGGKLFNLTIESLNKHMNDASDLEKILNDTEPNIWCVQYWLHFVVLDADSPWLHGALINNFDDDIVIPEFVDYFFSIARHMYDKGMSEISSRVLVTGIILVFYWTRHRQDLALTVFKNFFPVIFNHRRTEPFRKANEFIRSKLALLDKDKPNTPQHLLPYIHYLKSILDDFDYSLDGMWKLPQIESVGQDSGSIQSNSPCVFRYDLRTLEISQDHDDKTIATTLANIIAACLNANGGDIIIISLTLDENNKLLPPGDFFDSAIRTIFQFPKSVPYKILTKDDHIDEKKKIRSIWIRCYRSNRPTFTVIGNTSCFPVLTSSCGATTSYKGAEADKYISKYFPSSDQVVPLELVI